MAATVKQTLHSSPVRAQRARRQSESDTRYICLEHARHRRLISIDRSDSKGAASTEKKGEAHVGNVNRNVGGTAQDGGVSTAATVEVSPMIFVIVLENGADFG